MIDLVCTQFERASNWRDAYQAHVSPRAASWQKIVGSVTPTATFSQYPVAKVPLSDAIMQLGVFI